MNADEQEFAQGARKLFIIQLAIGGFVAGGFVWLQGELAAKSAIYGTFISMLLTTLLRWGVEKASKAAETNKKAGMGLLYMGAAVRFVLALVLFGVGLAALKLAPLPLVIGFCMTQAGYVIVMRGKRTAANRI